MKRVPHPLAASVLALICIVADTRAADPGLDPTEFARPPATSRPLTWMHAMNGNISEAGLIKDLEAMADAGLGGALLFNLGRGIPPGPVIYNSDDYRAMVVRAAQRAGELGLAFGVHNCDGWSASGGPWVPIEQSMKRLVWSETVVSGGAVDLTLPTPPAAHGLRRHVAVMAVPATAEEHRLAALGPQATISPAGTDAADLLDNDLSAPVDVRPDRRGESAVWVQLDYPEPFTARSVYIETNSRHGTARLEVSDDGTTFRDAGEIHKSRTGKNRWVFEQGLDALTARSFRIVFGNVPNGLGVEWVELLPWDRFDRWPGLTGMANTRLKDRASLDARTTFVPLAAVQDLSADFDPAAGRLRAVLPPGYWRILRFGFTSTGARNAPASASGIGWEIDKFDAAAMEHHFAAFVGRLAEEADALGSHGYRFAEIDSFEMGGQNWTDEMPALFYARTGYDLRPFLPLFAGVPLENANTVRGVLADLLTVCSELMGENYFRRFTELCHEHGLRSYIEPYGNGTFNGYAVGAHADIPMGEFWMHNPGGNAETFEPAVSVGHTHGKPVISAEAFTSWADLNWKVHPWLLKPSGDNAWAKGVNEFMFHRFTHQPNTHALPGMTMDNIGSHIDRTQTWWTNAGKAWMSYLTRGSHLLRQGVPHADVLLLAGEEVPVSHRRPSPVPPGYLADFSDAAVVRERLQVDDGWLVLPEGTRYRVLALTDGEPVSSAMLRSVITLVEQGATVRVGRKPDPLGYHDRLAGRVAFDALVSRLWGDAVAGWRELGQGRVAVGLDWPTIFNDLDLPPDLVVNGDGRYPFQHRRVGPDDLYYFFHDGEEPLMLTVSARVGDRRLELWNAEDGTRHAVPLDSGDAHSTQATITVQPRDAVFLVARPRDSGPVPPVRATALAGATVAVEGPWQVSFTDPFGETFERRFTSLTDWSTSGDPVVAHFSGTARYRCIVRRPAEAGRVELDLGDVQIAVEVFVNGALVGTLWRPPFRIDLSAVLQTGDNELEVRVTNLWTNRLIGDATLPDETGYAFDNTRSMPAWFSRNEPPPGPRRTFSTYDFHRTDRDLQPSGLLGPVRLILSP